MKWNSTDIKYENYEKKKLTDYGQRQPNQNNRLKAPKRVAEKNFSGPTYDTSLSHRDLMIFNCHQIGELS